MLFIKISIIEKSRDNPEVYGGAARVGGRVSPEL